MPENQTAWNSNNQGINEKINQNYQTSKAADLVGQLRKTEETGRLGAGLAAQLCGLCGRGCLKGTQRWLWATAGVSEVGEAPSLTGESKSLLKSTLETSR